VGTLLETLVQLLATQLSHLHNITMNKNHLVHVQASAPAKLTLFGEHFVVYGNAAILASINKRISVTLQPNVINTIRIKYAGMKLNAPIINGKLHLMATSPKAFLYPILNCLSNIQNEMGSLSGLDVLIDSQVPQGEGLGSSAASCVAAAGAFYSFFFKKDKKKIFEAATRAERNIHKHSSGADCYSSTFGGLLHYNPMSGHRRFRIKKKIQFVICTTGVKHRTQNLVLRVKRIKENDPFRYMELAKRANNICIEAKRALVIGDHKKLGILLSENHELLKKLNVSHPKLEEFISICSNSGALGCKLTGAGGGGAVIALIPNHNSHNIISEIGKKIPQSMLAELDFDGVQITQGLNSIKKF
jgi:mevalonate kinase